MVDESAQSQVLKSSGIGQAGPSEARAMLRKSATSQTAVLSRKGAMFHYGVLP